MKTNTNIEKVIISSKDDFKELVNKLEFRFAKTYANFAPHEYVVTNEENEKLLECIRLLNKYVQENYDEIENFYNKEYRVLFVDNHKYWTMEDWSTTNILNRNWDYKNEDGTTNTSLTKKHLNKNEN